MTVRTRPQAEQPANKSFEIALQSLPSRASRMIHLANENGYFKTITGTEITSLQFLKRLPFFSGLTQELQDRTIEDLGSITNTSLDLFRQTTLAQRRAIREEILSRHLANAPRDTRLIFNERLAKGIILVYALIFATNLYFNKGRL